VTSPIEALIDRTNFTCALCRKQAGTCDCWISCRCGRHRERGEPCNNCGAKPKKGEGRARPESEVLGEELAQEDWTVRVERLAEEVEVLTSSHDAPLMRALATAVKRLKEQDVDAADWFLDEAAMQILEIRAKLRPLKPE